MSHMSLPVVVAAAVVVATAPQAVAQVSVDSQAAIARSRYGEAVAAERSGGLTRARDLLVEAARAWPRQPVYLLAVARVSARLGDTAGTERWLAAAADLGLGLDLSRVKAFAPIAAAPGLALARTKLSKNLAPLARSDSVAGIADSSFYPEGVDYDPASRSFFVASVRHRLVARIGPDGKTAVFSRPGTSQLDAMLGVRVDARHGLVWATSRAVPAMEGPQPSDTTRSRVWAFDLASGRLIGMAEAPHDGAAHWFGDLVVHSSGAVYLTDSQAPRLYRARIVGGKVALEKVLEHRLFRSLQGAAFDPTERFLYLADYSHGLLRLDLASRRVEAVEAPAGTTTVGLDGIARYRGAIVGVQNGIVPARIVRLDLAPSGRQITAVTVIDRHLPVADEPTIGTVVGDRFVYVANSQWEKFDDAGHLKAGAVPRPALLLSVPIALP